METSVEAAELLAPHRPEEAELDGGADSASSGSFDPMEEFSRRLQVILRTHGSADVLQDKAVAEDVEADKTKEEAKVDAGTDDSLIKQSLSNAASPEEKLDELVQKYAQQAALRRREEQRASSLQQKLHVLLEERRGSVAARSKLEALCRDLQAHYSTLREETLRRCREDEQKRNDITNHFQETLTEIQAQIEQHSGRNDKLRQENANLTDKLESLMNQYERREESLEKINKHRDLQHKLTEAKLQQANALLAEAEEKHKREKEYLLREAIDKTKKCFAMKEQELDMKKKLTLYAQKFDEFQETLAKSNEIYVRFKKEMDNMTEKMKKVEKEANLWKSRFENCNKTLIDMIEERTEKGKEYDQFVLKIQKLEKLCHALQGERRGLYAKIREVRQANASIPSKLSDVSDEAAIPEIEGLQELQEEDPVLMASVARLREEQAKLQEFAAALLAAPESNEEKEGKDEADAEEDVVVSAIAQFKTKTAVKEDPVPAASQLEKRQNEVQDPPVVLPEAPEPTDPAASQEASRAQTQIQDGEVEAKRDEDVRHPGAPSSEPSEVDPEIVKVYPEPSNVYPEIIKVYPEPSNVDPEIVKVYPEPFNVDPELVKVDPEPSDVDPEIVKVDPEPEALKTKSLEETREAKPVLPVEDVQVQQQPLSGPEPVPGRSNGPSEGSTKAAASSTKQVLKKRKKRNSKAAS